MKKNILIYTMFLFLVSSLSIAQNITANLGGNTASDFFDIKDNSGNGLFRVNGTGKCGIGIATLTEMLNINGNLNFDPTGNIKIGGIRVLSMQSENTLVGFNTGENLTTGNSNTFIGNYAGNLNEAGTNNTFIGNEAGISNINADHNVIIGANAGYQNESGSWNVFIGSGSGNGHVSGGRNVFIGEASGSNNETGNYNVIIGQFAGGEGETCSHNVFVGAFSGKNAVGDSNVFIGNYAGFNEAGSNKLYIENSNSSSPLVYGDFNSDEITINGDLTVTGTITELSDRRYKTEIEPVKNVMQKIQAINAVYYKWDKEKHPDLVVSDEREIGVIAQDVEKVFPELVKTDDKGFKSVNYSKLSAVLLQVVKEQQQTINTILSKLEKIESRLEKNNSNNVNCKFVKN